MIRVLSFCLAAGMFVSGTASAGVILHEELSTDERPAQRLRPVHPGGQSESPLPPRPSIPTENLLDQMDIYALSPHAAALSLPRMVSPQLVLRAHAGKGTLPPPAVWRELVAKASGRYGLDPRLIAAVIKVESNFETIAESEKGAQGLMQLMPGTQQMLGVIDPFDPEANVDAGSRYLRQQIDRFGRLDLALAAYNAGPGNVLRYGGIPPFAETQAVTAGCRQLSDPAILFKEKTLSKTSPPYSSSRPLLFPFPCRARRQTKKIPRSTEKPPRGIQ